VIRALQTVWLLPRNAVILFLKGYRKVISPLYGDVCRFYPTCSAYGLEQVQQRGVVSGVVFTTWRILRCNPFNKGGLDPVKPGPGRYLVNGSGFVTPLTKKG
jgi:putative membrane protein insertion efficiency factor